VKQSMLFDCLREVVGKPVCPDNTTGTPLVTRHSIAEGRRRNIRILLVEDSKMNQNVALHILKRKLGCQADAVADGTEALRALRRRDYDLVLMDCQMPEMDGYEAARRIRDPRSDVHNHDICIIAMTANATKGDLEKCLQAGMDDYLSKPIKPEDLVRTIERNFSGEGAADETPEAICSQYADAG